MTEEEIERNDIPLIHHVLADPITRITPILGRGEVNRVYIVEQAAGKVIVRLQDKNELGRFKKEVWCMGEAQKKGIPTPRVFSVGSLQTSAYMVLEYMAGQNGKDITDPLVIWSRLGEYAQKIHTIPVSGFGETMTAPGIFNDSWERYLQYNRASLSPSDPLLIKGILTIQEQQHVGAILQEIQEKSWHFGLLHGDLSLANVIVNDDTITLLDWGCAEVYVSPDLELVCLLQNKLAENDVFFHAFLEGFGLPYEQYLTLKPEMEKLALLRNLDKLRWAIAKNPEKIEAFATRVKQLVTTVTNG